MRELLQITTRWTWGPGRLSVRIIVVNGGHMSTGVRAQFSGSGPDFVAGHELYAKAEVIAHGLAQLLPPPEPLDLGGTEPIGGAITGIEILDCRSSERPERIYLTVFVPRLDVVDMQAGRWLDQLCELITKANVFLPILTPAYLEGPVCKPELDLALRQTLRDGNKRIVPILVKGKVTDYDDTFLGGYHILDVTSGVTADTLQDIASLALGVSRNRFE